MNSIGQIFCVIGKLPHEGFSKTRLAKDLGDAAALEIYQAMLKDFFFHYEEKASHIPLQFYGTPRTKDVEVYFSELLREFPKIDFRFRFQNELSFFERLAEIFQSHANDYIHLTGTDIPMFPYEYLFDFKFSRNEVSIGPDTDGGFYYFGSYAQGGQVFSSSNLPREGSETVLESLTRLCKEKGLKVKLLKEWSDIDTVSDLIKSLTEMGPEGLPFTYQSSIKHIGKIG